MGAFSKLTVPLDHLGTLKTRVRELVKKELLVGIPDEGADRTPAPGEPSPPSNALIGYTMEFGSDVKRIPPRPFLAPGVESAKQVIIDQLQSAARSVLSGDAGAVDRGFAAAGILAENSVKAKITDGPFAPLSQRTIEARAKRGRKGAKDYLKLQGQGVPTDVLNDAGYVTPLVDTGQLRRAVTHVVRSK